jgi:pyruvate dehydrogenase E2 component (dihydrolipoamide acetyltransferase)
MPIDITMPALSPTMEEGKLAKWHVKEGDSVSSGDVIAEIETDKATMEVEAVDEGKIGKITVAEGTEGVKVNAVIAVLLQEGESLDAAAAPKAAPADEAPKAEAPRAAVPAPVVSNSNTGSSAPAAAPAPAPAKAEGGKVFASPLARRLAKEAGIEVSAISGTGPKGRVVKSDVEAAKSGKAPLKAASSSASAPAAGGAMAMGMSKAQVLALYPEGSYELVPTVPHFYLTLDCRIDALLAAREQINAQAPKNKDGKPEYKLSVNDFVMKAWAVALQRVPAANATWAGDSILYHKRSDVAVAVAVPGGLFTPVVKSCDTKTLREISEEVKDLATRAKSKKLAPHEYQGGSSSVSNLGMFGIKEFAAVINPPHGTILAVGVGEERVYADKGAVKIANFMTVTVSCDHRSVDGALGAELLGVFKGLIENPVMMLA